MSDWSYRYNKPRSQVHYERYGNTNVPPRRGMGGAKSMGLGSTGLFVAAAIIGTGILTYLLRKK